MFLDASKNYSASNAAYQSDYQAVIAKLGAMAETAPTLSYVDQQLALLGQIKTAVETGDTAMAAALQITYTAAQIDMGTAKNSLTIALEGIQDALNTTITSGTSKADIQAEISALQLKLNLGVTGTAKDSIDSAIFFLQLAMNGTISADAAQQSISDSYGIVQGALNGTINGTTAAGWIATEKLIVQAALNSSINGSTASLAIGIESGIAQLALSGALNGTQAKQAIDVERNIIQGTLDGSISGADARTKLLTEQKIIQDVLDGSIDGSTAANSLSSQFTSISSSLTTGLDSFVTKLGLYVKAMNDATTQAGANQTLLTNQNVALDTFTKAATTYQTTSTSLISQYRSGALSASDYKTQNDAAYAPVSAAYTAATNLGITSLPTTVEIQPTATDTAANLMDKYLDDKTVLDGYIARGVQVVKSNPGGVSPYIMLSQTDLVASDLANYRSAALSAGLVPAFATGGDHLGGWRIVGERGPELEATGQSRIFNADQTRNIFSNGQADNREMVSELKALRKEVKELRNEQKAGHVAIADNTGKTARQLSRWDGDGTPPVRDAA